MTADLIHNIHILGTVNNIHIIFVQLGEKGVIQLCRNNLDMKKIALL